ncbi:hypothetical protein OESDEN_04883 [Oesophagostomum dentatum]|uniref:Uncharacterized protein n=1 Tax=Oesophagostomum dentatum TaxID=61180 RepID=A0A0B1TGH7_OESDE|nr:hypothetical protein OESDEN_04883 [Oesophagostomum dentatum]
MLKKLNEAGKRFGLRINQKQTQFMKIAYSEGERMELEGSPTAETPSQGRPVNMQDSGRTGQEVGSKVRKAGRER